MLLDKDGYTPEALAPVRAAFAATLKDACLSGECTCGEATRYLASSEADRFDLAAFGCENGEAEGCAALAGYYDRGERVEKDAARARALYALTCPDIHAVGDAGEYSKLACDHLAVKYMQRPYAVFDRERAMYYASFACPSSGFEVDHAGCVHLAMLWAMKKTAGATDGANRSEAIGAAAGIRVPIYELATDMGAQYTECSRPSVAAECKELEKLLPSAK